MSKPATALAVVVTIAVVGGLYVVLRPQASVTAPSADPGAPAAVTAPGATPAEREIVFTITGELVAGPPSLRVKRGDRVTIRVNADRKDEVHLHGYDLAQPVKPGAPAVLAFVAAKAGRFELELHGGHVELGALEVEP